MSFFQDVFGTGGDATKAANAKIAGLNAAQAYADPLYDKARGDITAGYGKAQDIFNPIYATGLQGAQSYADITGAAGPEGQNRARALFQTDPGYQFARDEALKATARLQGTGGYQGSGNVMTALEDRASGLASKQYGDYVSRLSPFLNYSLAGGAGLSNAYTGQGTQLAGLDTSQAQLGYGTQAGIGSATASGITGDAASRAAGINNILKIGGAALGAFTGGAGGGLGSTLLGYLGNSGGGNAVSNSDPYGLSNYNYNYGFS